MGDAVVGSVTLRIARSLSICALSCAILPPTPRTVAAQPTPAKEALVIVKGVATPFSVFGLLKRLGQIPGVQKVTFDLSSGVADLRLRPDARVTDEDIRQAIFNASYTPGSIRWKAPGGDHED